MKIVTKTEMKFMPNGTVFMLYEPEMLDGEIRIMTGSKENGEGWNGELPLRPFFSHDESGEKRHCNWCTVDTADIDYDDDQLFAVFSHYEVQQMINALLWALTGFKTHFDMDANILDDQILNGDELDDYIAKQLDPKAKERLAEQSRKEEQRVKQLFDSLGFWRP